MIVGKRPPVKVSPTRPNRPRLTVAPQWTCEEITKMHTPACSRPSSYLHASSSRPPREGTKRFLGRAVLLLSLLVPGSPAFAQTTLTPATLSFGNVVWGESTAAKT